MALVLSGCALWRAEPPPALTSVPVAPDDPALSAALEGWSAVVAERSGLAGGVVLKLSGPQGERRISQNVVLERPARLRMEIQAFLTTAAVLVADGTRYDYFQSIDRYRESGPVHPTLLWEIAGVPLTLDQAVYFLLGGIPPRPGLRPGGGERWSDGRLRVDLHDARGRRARSLWFGAEGRLERAEEWSSDDRLRWQVGYDRYRDVGGQPFAHTIEFEFPRYEAQATVAFRTVELNPDVPDGTFELHLAGDGEGG
jgi:hypothetical protein